MLAEKTFVADPSPWIPISDPLPLKILGKFAEELFECGEVAADPDSSNTELADEIADVLCNRALVAEYLGVEPARVVMLPSPDIGDEYDLMGALTRCGAAVARCIIQGIDGAEPSTGKINRAWLTEEIDQLGIWIGHVIAHFDLDEARIKQRMLFKRDHLRRWHQLPVSA